MLNEEEVLGGGFLDADPSKYFLGGTNTTTSSSINRSLSMPPLYASQLSVDANPWNTDSQFETTVPDIGQNSTGGQNAVDDDILGTNLTAASVLGNSLLFAYYYKIIIIIIKENSSHNNC